MTENTEQTQAEPGAFRAVLTPLPVARARAASWS